MKVFASLRLISFAETCDDVIRCNFHVYVQRSTWPSNFFIRSFQMSDACWLFLFIASCATLVKGGLRLLRYCIRILNRRQKVFKRGLYVCAGTRGYWHSKIWQKRHWFIAFHISVWGTWNFVLGAKPTKAPRGDGTVRIAFSFTCACVSCKTQSLFWVVCHYFFISYAPLINPDALKKRN